MAGNTSESGRSVASRVLAIIGAFDSQHPSLSLSDISRRTGLSMSTTHRLVGELTQWRGLQRHDDGRYSIGLRLWESGLLGRLHTRLREVAMPFMQTLYESTCENVHLAIRDGHDAIYVEKLAGHRSIPTVSRAGGRLPLHATGVGKALIAWESVEFLADFLSRPLERVTPYTMWEPGRLQRELDEARRVGYAVTIEEMTAGTVSVACPILDRAGTPIAAVGLVVATVKVNPDALAPPVKVAADGIAARLACLTADDAWAPPDYRARPQPRTAWSQGPQMTTRQL